jgi:3D (Asp-Asp-Asp) domain-containing protein
VAIDGNVRRETVSLPPKATVAQALQALKIELAGTDRVWPALNSPAKDGMSIRVTRVRVETRKRREAVPFETLYQPSASLRIARQDIVQNGQSGVREIAEQVWTREGKESSRETVSTKLVQLPRPRIIALGALSAYLPHRINYHRRYARAYALAARGGLGRERAQMEIPSTMKPLRASRSLSVVATGYAAGRAGGSIGSRTATGLPAGYGAIAVDPRLIPLGSKLYIEGYGYGFACDTGGAIKGRHIDLCFDSPRAAFAHGRRQMKVWILE